MKDALKASFTTAASTLETFLQNELQLQATVDMAKQLADAFESGNKLLVCGNGGSACDAMHCAEEFTGRYRKNRRALPAIALTDPGYITCVANDFGYDRIFARGVEGFGKKGDVLISMSTSGNSPNVIAAVQVAKDQGLKTFNLLGKDGGKLRGTGDVEIIIPGETADRIQELHMLVLHVMIEGVERRLFPELYAD